MDDSAYRFLETQQFSHWWFRGRARIIESVMRRTLKDGTEREILDIGSGYGALIPLLRSLGSVDAIESHLPTHHTLAELGVRTIFRDAFPAHYPSQRYNAVTMFDVLEHIDNDAGAVATIREQLLAENGFLFITVPAYQWLWGPHDDHHGHKRRYSKEQIQTLLLTAGFHDIRVSYFMTILFPLAIAQRIVQKLTGQASPDEKTPPLLFNAMLYGLFSLESLIVPRTALPYGLSLIAWAQK